MPASTQIKLNAACCIKDLARLNWSNFCFHWRGVVRAFDSIGLNLGVLSVVAWNLLWVAVAMAWLAKN